MAISSASTNSKAAPASQTSNNTNSLSHGRNWCSVKGFVKVAAVAFAVFSVITGGVVAREYFKPPELEPVLDSWCPVKPVSFQSLCESTAYSNFTQEDIDALNWDQPLSVNPPLPARRNLDCQKTQVWVNAHIGDKGKRLAREFIKNIQYIPQENFEEAFRCTVQDFNKDIGTTDYMVYGSDPQKSEFWMASLALKHLNTLPREVTAHRNTILHENLTVRNVAIFDDGIYSGVQMRETLSEMGGALNKRFPDGNFKIHIVVPYIIDESRLANIRLKNGSILRSDQIKIHSHQTLLPVKERLAEYIQDDFFTAYNSGAGLPATKKSIIFYDHKVPDFFSNFETSFEGGVGRDARSRIEKISDWLKNATYASEGDYFCRSRTEPFLSFDPPPYKVSYLPQSMAEREVAAGKTAIEALSREEFLRMYSEINIVVEDY